MLRRSVHLFIIGRRTKPAIGLPVCLACAGRLPDHACFPGHSPQGAQNRGCPGSIVALYFCLPRSGPVLASCMLRPAKRNLQGACLPTSFSNVRRTFAHWTKTFRLLRTPFFFCGKCYSPFPKAFAKGEHCPSIKSWTPG